MDIESLYNIYLQYPEVSTDSRSCSPGCIFFALKGDRFDGNAYIESVLKNGAAYAVGDDPGLPDDERVIKVDDVLVMLQRLANHHRKQMPARIIGITGTNGKTTTKELIAATLNTQYNILYTEGNFNNHIGVPLTLLRMRPEHEYAIVEMGANHCGEIKELCQIAEPDYGLITNVGKAHLEGFGSFEGIIQTKTELYEYIRSKGGTIFANKDNQILREYLAGLNAVYYGSSPETYIWGNTPSQSDEIEVEWHKGEETNRVRTHLIGGYNLENILASICIASYFNVTSSNINRAISSYIPTNNRSQSKQTEHNKLIIDAYNANPTSMEAAIRNFAALDSSPKAVILGAMKELGQYSREEHEKVVAQLAGSTIDRVFLVGQEFQSLSGLPLQWLTFEKTDDLITYLQLVKMEGYTILIKGSRGNQLENTICFL